MADSTWGRYHIGYDDLIKQYKHQRDSLQAVVDKDSTLATKPSAESDSGLEGLYIVLIVLIISAAMTLTFKFVLDA